MKINRQQLMSQMVNEPESISSIYLICTELDLFKYIAVKGECGSKDVSNRFGISGPSATQRLTRLYDKGYLSRRRDDRAYKYSVSIK